MDTNKFNDFLDVLNLEIMHADNIENIRQVAMVMIDVCKASSDLIESSDRTIYLMNQVLKEVTQAARKGGVVLPDDVDQIMNKVETRHTK